METIDKKQFIKIVDNLISAYADKSYGHFSLNVNQLTQFEKEELVGYLISLKIVDDWEWIYESGQSKYLADLFSQALIKGTPEDDSDFINTMRQASVDYFEKTIQNIIDDRIPWVRDRENYENGLRPVHDRITGEVQYVLLEGRN